MDYNEAAQTKKDVLELLRAALSTPEDLARVPQMLEEKEAVKDAHSLALAELVTMHTETVSAGMHDLLRANLEVNKIKANFVGIQQLCRQSDVLSNTEHNSALQLAMAYANIDCTLIEVEEIHCIPRKADDVMAMLAESETDPGALLEAYEVLALLRSASTAAEEMVRTGKSKIEDVSKVQHHFDRVNDANEQFELKLFSYFDNVIASAKECPRHLVTALRIVMAESATRDLVTTTNPKPSYRERCIAQIQGSITSEMQPLLSDASRLYEAWWRKSQRKINEESKKSRTLEASNAPPADAEAQVRVGRWTGGGQHLVKLQSMVGRGLDGLQTRISSADMPELEDRPLDVPTVDDDAVNKMLDILDRAKEAVSSLSEFYDHVAPCFPMAMKPMELVVFALNENMSKMLDYLGQGSENYDTSSLLELLGWACQYRDILLGLGLPDEAVHLNTASVIKTPNGKPVVNYGLDMARFIYVGRTQNMLVQSFRNLAEIDLDKPPSSDGEGRLWTPGVIEMFRLLTEQVILAASVKNEETTVGVSRVALTVMVSYQELVQEQMHQGGNSVGFEMLVAIVNNNMIAYDQSLDLASTITTALIHSNDDNETPRESNLSVMSDDVERVTDHAALERLIADVNMDSVSRGFLEVSKLAMLRVVDSIMTDAGTLSLLKQLHCTPDWLSGGTTATWIATLKDYLRDLKIWLDATFFKRSVQLCLTATTKVYRDAMLTQMPRGDLDKTAIVRMETDYKDLLTFFSEFLVYEKVEEGLESLEHLNRIIACETADEFEEQFHFMLVQDSSQMTPADIGKICAKRKDISRADATVIQKECDTVYQEWKAKEEANKVVIVDHTYEDPAKSEGRGNGIATRMYTPLLRIFNAGQNT